MIDLHAWGWDEWFEEALERLDPAPDHVPARIVSQHRGGYRVVTEAGDALAMAPGKMRFRAAGQRQMPAVGDWVLVRTQADGPAVIEEILTRKTEFVRRRAGTDDREQVIAANIDVAFLVTSLNQDLSLRRLERYLVATWESGARPVVLLSKADLVEDAATAVREVEEISAGAEVVAFSALDGTGLGAIRRHLAPGRTVVLLGSSGVGKSTLVNRLAGEDILRTQEVRESDDRGRHTTTQRMLFLLPDGSLLLDTPGMREIGLVDAQAGLGEAFDDVERLAGACKFRDCRHESEPGCAVREALASGDLSEERWEAFLKLQREAAWEHRRTDETAARAERARWKQIHKDLRAKPDKGS